MTAWDYFVQLIIIALEVASVAALLALALRSVFRRIGAGVARRDESRRRQQEYLATVVRLAWMLVDRNPSKVVYFTRDDVDATPEAAYLKLELTPKGYALKSADAPDGTAHEQFQVG